MRQSVFLDSVESQIRSVIQTNARRGLLYLLLCNYCYCRTVFVQLLRASPRRVVKGATACDHQPDERRKEAASWQFVDSWCSCSPHIYLSSLLYGSLYVRPTKIINWWLKFLLWLYFSRFSSCTLRIKLAYKRLMRL